MLLFLFLVSNMLLNSALFADPCQRKIHEYTPNWRHINYITFFFVQNKLYNVVKLVFDKKF